MSIFNFLKSRLVGNVDSNFYSKNKKLLQETNYSLLKIACLFSFCMCAFLFSLTFFHTLMLELKHFYLFFMLFFALESLIVLTYVKKHKIFTGFFFYIFAIAILLLATYLGTFNNPNVSAVSFYVFLVIIPMLHVGPPIFAVILSMSSCLCFSLLAYFVKASYPEIALNDILNAICCSIVGIGLNITFINLQLENIQSKVHLEYISFTDELTTLPNRRSLNLRISSIFDENYNNINILMMDIDNFKNINDIFGHLEGDNCLAQIGKLLKSIGMKHNLFIARFGGEEFVALSTYHSIDEMESIANNIIKSVEALDIANTFSTYGKATISIGQADLISTGAKNYMELLDFADDALYISKTTGKNKVSKYRKFESFML